MLSLSAEVPDLISRHLYLIGFFLTVDLENEVELLKENIPTDAAR